MNEAIATRWIEELESGRWKKGVGQLHVQTGAQIDVTKDRFCCLGVLCRMAINDGVRVGVAMRRDTRYRYKDQHQVSYNGKSGELPEQVRTWAGLRTRLGEIPHEEPKVPDDLSSINDRTSDFSAVVAAIRTHTNVL